MFGEFVAASWFTNMRSESRHKHNVSTFFFKRNAYSSARCPTHLPWHLLLHLLSFLACEQPHLLFHGQFLKELSGLDRELFERKI